MVGLPFRGRKEEKEYILPLIFGTIYETRHHNLNVNFVLAFRGEGEEVVLTRDGVAWGSPPLGISRINLFMQKIWKS